MGAVVCEDQKMKSDILEQDLQVVLSCLMWVLAVKCVSSGRAVCPLDSEMSSAPACSFMYRNNFNEVKLGISMFQVY